MGAAVFVVWASYGIIKGAFEPVNEINFYDIDDLPMPMVVVCLGKGWLKFVEKFTCIPGGEDFEIAELAATEPDGWSETCMAAAIVPTELQNWCMSHVEDPHVTIFRNDALVANRVRQTTIYLTWAFNTSVRGIKDGLGMQWPNEKWAVALLDPTADIGMQLAMDPPYSHFMPMFRTDVPFRMDTKADETKSGFTGELGKAFAFGTSVVRRFEFTPTTMAVPLSEDEDPILGLYVWAHSHLSRSVVRKYTTAYAILGAFGGVLSIAAMGIAAFFAEKMVGNGKPGEPLERVKVFRFRTERSQRSAVKEMMHGATVAEVAGNEDVAA